MARVAFVTGGTRGIGKAIVQRLHEDGFKVAAGYSGNDEAAKAIADALDVMVVKGNVGSFDDCARAVKEVEEQLGPIDILVNNAGIIRREDAIRFSEQDWDDVINLNLKTVFFFSQAVARQYLAQGSGGKIINVASMLSFQGGVRVPSYTASKSGVMGITRLMANEWASHGINVNAIAPGYMATNNTVALRQDENRNAAILERIPAGRWGVPDDLAGPVVFLASKASDYVNGYTVAVDGGWLAR